MSNENNPLVKQYVEAMLSESLIYKNKSNNSKTSVGKKYFTKKLIKNNKKISNFIQLLDIK